MVKLRRSFVSQNAAVLWVLSLYLVHIYDRHIYHEETMAILKKIGGGRRGKSAGKLRLFFQFKCFGKLRTFLKEK